ncbi:MAG: alpha-N-arabinofuranosidase, partial [Ruminiclostridium sp.]|nr:alpha-N-arabinofuranosidase [Ruminiclostridium sp.]
AIVAAVNLNIFNQRSNIVCMANLAQAVNVLQCLVMTEGDKLLKTPTYHVFDMFKTHQDAELLYSYTDNTETNGIPAVSQSVSMDRDGKITMTFSNASLGEDFEIDCSIVGAQPKTAEARILTGDVRAYNDFTAPEKLKPAEHKAEITSGGVKFTLPKCSVVSIILS